MIDKKKLEKIINEVIREDSVLLSRPEPKKPLSEDKELDASEDK